MIEFTILNLLTVAIVIGIFLIVINPSKKVCKDKFDLDFTGQDKINKEVNI